MAITMAAPSTREMIPAAAPALVERVPRFLRHPIGLALVSAGLLWLSFPPAGWHAAAWFALVPLFAVIADPRPIGRMKLVGSSLIGGFVFWLMAVQWILVIDPSAWLGWLAMALALALFWVTFVGVSRWILRRTSLPLTVVAPVVWVALEYVRAFVLTGFPWYYLAHTQYRQVYWTQIADFAGSLGLSFLIALVNATIVECLLPFLITASRASVVPGATGWRRVPTRRWVRLGLVAASALGTLGYGAYRVKSAAFRAGPRVAMLQTNEVQEYGPAGRKSSNLLHQILLTLVENAVTARLKPDLIVWPETAYPFGLVTIDPDLTSKQLDEQAKLYYEEAIGDDLKLKRDRSNAEFRRLMERYKVPMMIGLTTYQFATSGYSRFNSSVLFRPGAEPQSYHKLHLVPFGEYVPLVDVLPWLTWLTPYTRDQMPTLKFGEAPAWFDLGPYRLAAAICFEDTVPHVVRRFFSEVPDAAQPDLIVNLSNDGWFHATSEHEMHLAVSTFRCVENRVPMARAVNTGTSAMIDGNGAVVAALRPNTQAVLSVVAPLDDRTSLYSRWGDWLGQVTLAGTIGFLVLGCITRRPLASTITDVETSPSSGTLSA